MSLLRYVIFLEFGYPILDRRLENDIDIFDISSHHYSMYDITRKRICTLWKKELPSSKVNKLVGVAEVVSSGCSSDGRHSICTT